MALSASIARRFRMIRKPQWAQAVMPRVSIVFVSARPAGEPLLNAEEEFRDAEGERLRSEFRDVFSPITYVPAASPTDLERALAEHDPVVLHLSVHGTDGYGPDEVVELSFVNEDGQDVRLSEDEFKNIVGRSGKRLRVIILSACKSLGHAETVAAIVPCAVGTREEIENGAARAFSRSFYMKLFGDASVQDAFEAGRDAAQIAASDKQDCYLPKLKSRGGIDTRSVYLLGDRPGLLARARMTRWATLAASVVLISAALLVGITNQTEITDLRNRTFGPPVAVPSHYQGDAAKEFREVAKYVMDHNTTPAGRETIRKKFVGSPVYYFRGVVVGSGRDPNGNAMYVLAPAEKVDATGKIDKDCPLAQFALRDPLQFKEGKNGKPLTLAGAILSYDPEVNIIHFKNAEFVK